MSINRVANALEGPQGGFSITAGASALSRPIRWFNTDTDGEYTFTLAEGQSVTLYLVSGVLHSIGAATHVTAAEAGATMSGGW